MKEHSTVFVKRKETVCFCKLEQLIKKKQSKIVEIGFKCRKRYNIIGLNVTSTDNWITVIVYVCNNTRYYYTVI